MKKLTYAGLACFMLLAAQACSGNAQKSTSDEVVQETVSQPVSDPVYDKIMKLIEEATAKIKENPNPQEAMKVMAKNLSDDLKKNYEEATARFMEACEKIK